MRVELQDLELDHLWIVYPGDEGYELDDRISVLPVAELGRLADGIAAKGWWATHVRLHYLYDAYIRYIIFIIMYVYCNMGLNISQSLHYNMRG